MPTSPPPTTMGAQVFAPYDATTSPYDSTYGEQGQLERQSSITAPIYNENGQLVRQPSIAAQHGLGMQNPVGSNAHYVDLARSSVTPFQAAQYAEISRKLNEAPSQLHGVNEEAEEPDSSASDHATYAMQAAEAHSHLSIPAEGGSANPESPFADPQIPAEAHVVPPSPIYSLHPQNASNKLVVSEPPMLPEVRLPERTFSPTSYDFPQTPSARPTPSPFHTNFNIPGSPSRQMLHKDLAFGATESAPSPAQATVPGLATRDMTPKPESRRPTSTYTVYDETDAYGGF